MPAIEIERDTAQEAAERELGKPIYPKPSLTDRLSDWFDELLYRIATDGSSIPGGWFTVSVLVILLVAAVVVAVRVARRAMRTDRGNHPLFDRHELSAAEHRTTAEQYAAAGDWSAAIRHRLRAIARRLEETEVLTPVPGRTATELARHAGRTIPDLDDEFAQAATAFNDVTYGGRLGTEPAYRAVADLDDHLRFHIPATAGAPATAGLTDGWAQVR